jgi:acetyl-CoA carboxylase alpha subunit
MYVLDELNQSSLQIPSEEILALLKLIKAEKEEGIERIKNKIIKFEQEKRAEEAFYQSLSPFRKLFASRAPNHHLAVEYMVHVKEREKQIKNIKQRILELDAAIDLVRNDLTKNKIVLSSTIFDELMLLSQTEEL